MGALVLLYGSTRAYPQPFYIVGSFALLITAIYFQLLYFVALEIILAAGHTAILIGVGTFIRMSLPVLLCFQLLIFYLMVGKENLFLLLIGIIGIALLSLGFSHNDQWVFFSGSSLIAIYAYYNGYRGNPPAYIWALLNTSFAFIALYKLFIKVL